MLYLIIGIAIMLFILKKISGESLIDFLKTDFKYVYAYILIALVFISFIAFCMLGSWLGLNKPNYIQTDANVYELMEYGDREYFIEDDYSKPILDRIKVRFLKDGFLEEEKFDEDIVKIKISDDSNKQATIEIVKEKKVEPNTFEKVFFLKGYFYADEELCSVVLSLPRNSKFPNK